MASYLILIPFYEQKQLSCKSLNRVQCWANRYQEMSDQHPQGRRNLWHNAGSICVSFKAVPCSPIRATGNINQYSLSQGQLESTHLNDKRTFSLIRQSHCQEIILQNTQHVSIITYVQENSLQHFFDERVTGKNLDIHQQRTG